MDLRDQLQFTLGTSYTIERELGGGGMSRVFVATETALGRKVVVKLLAPELTADINVDRFEREILVAAKLQHPHIVPVLAAGESNGLPYYTMPFVEGESVRARLAHGPFSIAETVSVLRDVARALAYAHERGIVHRDIKPDNVLLSGGSATVTDFGIAKAISASRTLTAGATLTQVGTSIGTPAYMAPEQAAADPTTDHRADIYAFGCMAYELLAGRPPFVDPTPQRLLAAQMASVPLPVQALRPDTPPALADLVARCLEKNADDRPQSAADLGRALDTVSTQNPSATTVLGQRGTLRRALLLYVAAVVVVIIVARAAIIGIGLPDWVFPGSLIVMALGLPVILVTAYAHHSVRRSYTTTPTVTPGGTERHGTMATLAMKASPHLSWRRTAFGGVYAFGAFILLIGAFMLMRAFGIGPVGSLLASGKLSAREKLVIADFAVTNTDPALGAVVSDAVRAGLAQSSVITLVPSTSVASTLRLMKRDPTTRLDIALARELAQRQGVKAVVDGSVTGVSGGYIVSLRLVTADSGIEMASFRETGDGPRGLIDAADKLARELRGKVGESLRLVQATPPLAEATTGSLEALRKYSAAIRANNIKGNPSEAVDLAREAVAIDSTFGSAWRVLTIALGNVGAPQSSRDSAMERAYRYRDRMPEMERLNTVATYYMTGPHRDRSKWIAAYEAIQRKDDRALGNNIGNAFQSRRDFARAESVFASDMRRDSGLSISYTNMAESQIDQGKVTQAMATLDLANRRFGGGFWLYTHTAWALYAAGKTADAERNLDSLRKHGDPALRPEMARALIPFEVLHARVSAAKSLAREWTAAVVARGTPSIPLTDSLGAIETSIWLRGPSAGAVRDIDDAIATMPFHQIAVSDRPYIQAARVYALAATPNKARAVLDERQRAITDTALIRLQQSGLHRALAEIALAEHKPIVALAQFRRADVGDDGFPSQECGPCVLFDIGRAFDAADMRDSAIATYEAYIATPSYLKIRLIDATALAGTHKRLGELYEAKGDRERAAAHYAQFVQLWKDADPEFQPAVADVKRRLFRLAADRPR